MKTDNEFKKANDIPFKLNIPDNISLKCPLCSEKLEITAESDSAEAIVWGIKTYWGICLKGHKLRISLLKRLKRSDPNENKK